jgi:uncharacterized membrane protein YkvA (DUF1232 family)
MHSISHVLEDNRHTVPFLAQLRDVGEFSSRNTSKGALLNEAFLLFKAMRENGSTVFDVLRMYPSGTQRFKHGLYPHWIYQPAKADDPQRLSLTLAEVHSLMERESKGELRPIVKEVGDLMNLASDGAASSGDIKGRRIQAISVLLYLLNPYDDLYDFHDGIGYQDDIEQVRQVYSSLFAKTNPFQTC